MSKAPIVILGTAAVVGIAIAASRKSTAETTTTTAPVPVKGTSAADITAKQKKKVEDWAKKKGIPVDQAVDLAKQVFATKF